MGSRNYNKTPSTIVVVFFVIAVLVLLSTKQSGIWHFRDPVARKVHSAACAFYTNIPMYYINLERSTFRRVFMERTFGSCGKLFRVSAVDGNQEDVETLLGGGGLAAYNLTMAQFLNEMRASKNEIAVTMSHFKAIHQAYNDNAPVALIFEDDVSPALASFWRLDLEEVVEALNLHDSLWELARLQFSFAVGEDRQNALRRWRRHPESNLFSGKYYAYGCVANLFSRRGLEKLVSRFFDQEGKMDCKRRKTGSRCVSDFLIYQELDHVYLRTPPMFVTRISEGSTGVRKNGRVTKVSDHSKVHYTYMLESLQWALEDFEHRISKNAWRSERMLRGTNDSFVWEGPPV